MAFTAVALGSGALGLFYIYKKLTRPKAIPGPGSYPLVGSSFHIEQPLDEFLYEKYRDEPLVQVQFGTCTVYYLNTYSSLKEAYITQADVFTGRPLNEHLGSLITEGVGGFLQTDGHVWREYKQSSLKYLRDFGFGRKGAEDKIRDEASYLLEAIDEAKGSPIDTKSLLSRTVSNIICQLIFGSRVASEDPRFEELMAVVNAMMQDESSFLENAIFFSMDNSWMRHVFGRAFSYLAKKGFAEQLKGMRKLFDFFGEHIEKRKREYKEGSEAKDFIEALIIHAKTTEYPELYTSGKLVIIIFELFLAGTDTTTNTLRWAILYTIKYPQVADKIFKEIRSEIGTERLPMMSDRQKLQYTTAAIEEVLRLASLFPSGLNHRCLEDTVIAGHKIPKDSIFLTSVYSINRDPKIFPEPFEFKPERFLDASGRFASSDSMVTFSVGKRACMGEGLARTELFVFFTALMQRFTFHLDPENERSLEDLLDKPFTGVNTVRSPRPHKIIFKHRH